MNSHAGYNTLSTSGDSPNPRPGFETELVEEVKNLVAALPAGTADLRISRPPGHPEWSEPYFEVVPRNPKAAPLKGIAVITDLNLTVGEAWREFVGFARGGTVIRGLEWQEEFRQIWFTVTRGGFAAQIYRGSQGKAIGWATKFRVGDTEVFIRNGRKREKLFDRPRLEVVTYQSYLEG